MEFHHLKWQQWIFSSIETHSTHDYWFNHEEKLSDLICVNTQIHSIEEKKRKTNNENANFYHCFWYTYHKLLSHFEGEKIAIYVQLIKLLWHCNIYIGVLFVDDVFSFFQSFSLKQKPIKITPKSTAKSLLLYSFDEENKQTKIFVLLLCVCLYIYFYFALPCHECSSALLLMMTGSTLHFFLYRLHCAKRRKIDLY